MTTFLMLTALVLNAQKAEDLIRQTVEGEAKALRTGKPDLVRSYWKFDKTDKRIILTPSNSKGDIGRFSGADLVVDSNFPPAFSDTFQNFNYDIRVSGSLAFARYETIQTNPDGSKIHSHRIDLLEKVGQDWKIVGVSKQEYIPK